jgi:hypothetical protein
MIAFGSLIAWADLSVAHDPATAAAGLVTVIAGVLWVVAVRSRRRAARHRRG